MNTPKKKLALLIDGDNAQLQYTKQIIEFCQTRGSLKIKNAYGDWKQNPLLAHCQTITSLSIKRVQQNRVGKDATDFRLAMDVALFLAKGEVETYIIVSSDAGFAAVCEQIRQKGAKVIGIGTKKSTSEELTKSYNEFFYIEAIVKPQIQPLTKTASTPKSTPAPILEILIQAHQKAPQQDGWVNLGEFGNVLRQTDNQFEERFAGKRLSTWFKDFPQKFEIVGDRVRIKSGKKKS